MGRQTIVGGMLVQLVLGTLGLWGSVDCYVTSYLRLRDPTVSPRDTFLLFTMSLSLLSLSCLLTRWLASWFTAKFLSLLGVLLHSSGLLLASFSATFSQFLLAYGGVSGLGAGLALSSTYMVCWSDFQMNKGKVLAVLSASYAASMGLTAVIASYIVNPRNASPLWVGTDWVYGAEVAGRVPSMLRTLAAFSLVVGTAGLAFMTEIPSEFQIVRHPPRFYINCFQFCKLPFAIIFVYSFPLLQLGSLKTVFFGYFLDDWTLTLACACGSVGCAAGRWLFAEIYQKTYFKVCYSGLLLLQCLLGLTLHDFFLSPALFCLWLYLLLFIEGGHFALLPSTCISFLRAEAAGSLFAVVYGAIAAAAWVVYAVQTTLWAYVGALWISRGFTALTLVGMLVISTFEETYTERRQGWMDVLQVSLQEQRQFLSEDDIGTSTYSA